MTSFRFWLIYCVAWLPLTAVYVTLFMSHLGRGPLESLNGSLFNVLPAALLGVAVVAICERVPWVSKKRGRFFLTHFFAAILYATLWSIIVILLFIADRKPAPDLWLQYIRKDVQEGFDTGLTFYLAIAGILYAVQTTRRLRAEQDRASRAESLRTKAELATLRAQLNPHFLFNTLHSLISLVRNDPQEAENAIERLADLLRHTLLSKSDADDVELSEELDFIAGYLALERLRLGARLGFEQFIEPTALNTEIPPFTLQPLVENAIKHGIAPQVNGGTLIIRAKKCGGVLNLSVEDNGAGTTLEELAGANGSGLQIARQRLLTRFGDRAKFMVSTRAGEGFKVMIKIPATE